MRYDAGILKYVLKRIICFDLIMNKSIIMIDCVLTVGHVLLSKQIYRNYDCITL